MSKKNLSSAQLNRQFDAVNDMFRDKKAYETPQERLRLKTLSIVFNVLSAALFSSFAVSFKLPMAEKIGACIAWLVLAVVVELAKRTYGAKYKSFDLAHMDESIDEAQQSKFYENSRKNLLRFISFVIFSFAVAIWSGSRNAYLFSVESVEQQEFTEKRYDNTLLNAVTLAQQNHQAAIKSDRHDIGSHNRALNKYNAAVEKWEAHKKEVDDDNKTAKAQVENLNKSLKTEGHDDGLKFALIAAVLSLIVEFFSIFYLFEYLESCFEVFQSYKENAEIVTEKGTKKTVNIRGNFEDAALKLIQMDAETIDEDEEEMYLRKLAEIQKRKKS